MKVYHERELRLWQPGVSHTLEHGDTLTRLTACNKMSPKAEFRVLASRLLGVFRLDHQHTKRPLNKVIQWHDDIHVPDKN